MTFCYASLCRGQADKALAMTVQNAYRGDVLKGEFQMVEFELLVTLCDEHYGLVVDVPVLSVKPRRIIARAASQL